MRKKAILEQIVSKIGSKPIWYKIMSSDSHEKIQQAALKICLNMCSGKNLLSLEKLLDRVDRDLQFFENSNNGLLNDEETMLTDRVKVLLSVDRMCHTQFAYYGRKGSTILHVAAIRANANVVRLLVNKCNYALDICDASGRTPLHAAISEYSTSASLMYTCADIVRFLLDSCEVKGIDVENYIYMKDNTGHCAACLAIKSACLPVVNEFWKWTRKVNRIKSCDFNSALFLAVQLNYPDLVFELLKAGAVITDAVLFEAVCLSYPDVLRVLLDAGAMCYYSGDKEETLLNVALMGWQPEIIHLLDKTGPSWAYFTLYNESALHTAVRGGCAKMVRHCLKHVVDVNRLNSRRETALMLAVGHNSYFESDKVEICELLLHAGANFGHRCLRRAFTIHPNIFNKCKLNTEFAAEMLIIAGVNVTFPNAQ